MCVMTPPDPELPRPPRAVAVADVVTVVVVVLAAVVAIGGGFRIWIGDARVSITSPLRLLLIALAVTAIRHARLPRPSLPARALGWIRHLQRNEHWRGAWPAFVITRTTVLSIGLLAVVTVGFQNPELPFRVSPNEAVNLGARWDAGWYLGIATRGYKWQQGEAETQQNVAFFPAFPMLTRVLGRILGGSSMASYLIAGVIISHAAFLWGLIYFHRLARQDLGSDEKATWAVYLLATYPFAMFYGAVYTESLFFLGCVGAIVELRRQRLLRAAAWGLLVGLSRPNGFLLTVTLAAVAAPGLFRDGLWSRRALTVAATIAAPVAGVVAFSGYVWWLTGNPLQWSAQHAAWGRTFEGLAPFMSVAQVVSEQGIGHYVTAAPYDALNAAAIVTTLALLVPLWRSFGVPYVLFVCANLIPPLFKGGVMSMGRLCATLFPIFLVLALKLSPRAAFGVTLACLALQAFLAVLFYTWRPLI